MHTNSLIGGDIVSNGKLLQARDIAQCNALSGNTDNDERRKYSSGAFNCQRF